MSLYSSEHKEKVLVISDTQFPFHHETTFKFLKHLKEVHQPTRIVHIGDVFDMHAFSRYPKDPDAYGALGEFERAMEFKSQLLDLFPVMDVMKSNHDVRIFTRLQEAGIPRRFWPTYEELFECQGQWKFHDSLEIDDVEYLHGHQIPASGGSPMLNSIKRRMKSCVFGHFHTRFGIDYLANQDNLLFGMCVGCLIDEPSYAFQYQRLAAKKPIVGTGIVDRGIPTLIPMPL